ncbi:MAG: L-lactate permease, partial [Collinsella sp.]
VFTYNLCVRTGAMDVIGSMITSISSDRRLLALLVAWCFGGFMEGMAGFGTAVAIPAGMLAGLGFEAVPAVLICLLANGVPTPYGSIGIPTVSVADLVGLDSCIWRPFSWCSLRPLCGDAAAYRAGCGSCC